MAWSRRSGRPATASPLTEAIIATFEDFLTARRFGEPGTGDLSSVERRRLTLAIQRLIDDAELQILELSADKRYMADRDLDEQTSAPDGPLDVEDQPVSEADVERLLSAGAPTWMVEHARDLIGKSSDAALV